MSHYRPYRRLPAHLVRRGHHNNPRDILVFRAALIITALLWLSGGLT